MSDKLLPRDDGERAAVKYVALCLAQETGHAIPTKTEQRKSTPKARLMVRRIVETLERLDFDTPHR